MNQDNNNEETQSTLQYIISHHKLPHFIAYSFNCVCFGMMITCLGPMFPYLAAEEDRSQTQYSFLFTCRAFGFILGAVSVGFVEQKCTLHHLLTIGTSTAGLLSVFFYVPDSLEVKGLTLFIGSIGLSYLEVSINLSCLETFKKDNTAMWLQLIHGFFGIGGLLGPFIVYLLELKTLIFIGILLTISGVSFFWIPTPQHSHINQNQSSAHQKQLPKISLYLICTLFFFIIGAEVSFVGWIPSFAVLNQFSTKQHATMYSSLFWISMTVCRFILATIKGKPSKKLQILALSGLANSAVSYFLIFHVNHEFGLVFMSIVHGGCNSIFYALLLTTPEEFGFKVTISDTTKFVIWGSLGEACLAVGVGKLMGWFSYNWFIYSIIFMCLGIYGISKWNTKIMSEENERKNENSLLDKRKFFGGQSIELRDVL